MSCEGTINMAFKKPFLEKQLVYENKKEVSFGAFFY